MDFEHTASVDPASVFALIYLYTLSICKSSETAKVRPFLIYSTLFTGFGIVSAATKPLQVKNSKMATPLSDLLQNADQLFDENQFQETLDVLSKHEVLLYPVLLK